MKTKHKLRGNQEILFIWGLTLQVTTKLLQGTVRPLIPQVELNFLINGMVDDVHGFFQVHENSLPLIPTINTKLTSHLQII